MLAVVPFSYPMSNMPVSEHNIRRNWTTLNRWVDSSSQRLCVQIAIIWREAHTRHLAAIVVTSLVSPCPILSHESSKSVSPPPSGLGPLLVNGTHRQRAIIHLCSSRRAVHLYRPHIGYCIGRWQLEVTSRESDAAGLGVVRVRYCPLLDEAGVI